MLGFSIHEPSSAIIDQTVQGVSYPDRRHAGVSSAPVAQRVFSFYAGASSRRTSRYLGRPGWYIDFLSGTPLALTDSRGSVLNR